jgi:hypothetical protein
MVLILEGLILFFILMSDVIFGRMRASRATRASMSTPSQQPEEATA